MVAGHYAAISDFRPQGHGRTSGTVVIDRGTLLASANAKNSIENVLEPKRWRLHAVYMRLSIALNGAQSFSCDPGHNFQASTMPFARINEGTVLSLLAKGELSIRTGSEVRFVERFMTHSVVG